MGWDDKGGPRRPRGSGGFDKIPDFDINKVNLPPINKNHIFGAAALFFILWLATGFYRVELQEEAVVLVFGVHSDTTGPGLHWNLPTPFGQVAKVRVEEIKRIEVGFRSGRNAVGNSALQKESLMLTQGANMINIQMAVQYQITDPALFLFEVADPFIDLGDRGLYETVKNVAEASLREVVGTTDIDNILTIGKSQVQIDVQVQMQKILDKYKTGLSVSGVQLLDVHPPDQVRDSFRDVNNAEEDKNTLKRKADGYRNSLIPEARGMAAEIIAKAEAYKEKRISEASGDALRFEAQLKEYRKAPKITRKRLSIETMEEVLTSVDKVVVDPKLGKSVIPLLNLSGKSLSLGKENN